MRPDENGDDHCARRVALHAHEGGMEEKFIRSVLAQDHEPVALGDTQPLEERLVERIGECALLCAREAACGNMGLETGLICSPRRIERKDTSPESRQLLRIRYPAFALKKKT